MNRYVVTLTEAERDYLLAVVKLGSAVAMRNGIDMETMITAARALLAAQPEGDK